MKTLKNYLVLYDEECPMCNFYTQAMVKNGFLESSGRASYQNMPVAACPYVDRQRAVNEIALLNTQTGEVEYGIKSLFRILGNSFPLFNPLFNFSPFVWIMSKIYAFISYNRRVIIPPKVTLTTSLQPTFKLKYRIAYLLLTGFLSSLILTEFQKLVRGSHSKTYVDSWLIPSILLVQAVIIYFATKSKRWDYLGNFVTVALAGSLLLLPALVINSLTSLPVTFYLVYATAVAIWILIEHFRRAKLLQISQLLALCGLIYLLAIAGISIF